MRRQTLIRRLSRKHRDKLHEALDAVGIGLIAGSVSLRSYIIRQIASSIYRKKSTNVPDKINPLLVEELVDLVKEFITSGEFVDVIAVIKLRSVLNDIHLAFKLILQTHESTI